MAGTPIRGRDYRSYEYISENTKSAPISDPYKNPLDIVQPKGSSEPGKKGTEALFNRYYTFFYTGPYGKSGSSSVNLFENPEDWKPDSVERNPTASKLIEWSRQGKNSIEYNWEDFLWCKNYGKVPNNYMITLRRFGNPINDNLINPEANNTPDIGRMVAWMDGEKNKLEDLIKFSTKINWKEFESSIQTYTAQSYGGNGGGGSLIGKILGATDTAGAKTQLQGEGNANHDPYTNTENKILGPVNVIKKMMMREQGVEFEQSIKIVFEYEMRSIDGINEKAAFLDLMSNVLMCTYNRAEFWGGAKRFVGGKRVSNPIAGQEGMAKLAKGDFGGFLGDLAKGFQSRISSLTGGKGLSLEGIGNAIKNVGTNVASRAAGSAMEQMGRPQAQATMALLTGEDTGEWHVTIGNPTRPILSLGNMVCMKAEMKFLGPLNKDDFPTKFEVVVELKPARPRDRDDIQMMFAPNNQDRLYSSSLDYIKKTYPNNFLSNLGGSGDQTVKQNPGANNASTDIQRMNAESNNFENLLKQRFPNHAPGAAQNVSKRTT